MSFFSVELFRNESVLSFCLFDSPFDSASVPHLPSMELVHFSTFHSGMPGTEKSIVVTLGSLDDG